MTINELFFILLRSALWHNPPEWPRVPGPEEWRIMFDLSQTHAVQGLLFDAISGLPLEAGVPSQLAAEWMVEVGRIEKAYEEHCALVTAMHEFWQKNGVRAILMKGTVVAAMYTVPCHRVLGDIDWWIPGDDNWNKALELIANKGYEILPDSDGDCHYTVGGIVIEHHREGYVTEGPVGVLLMLNGHIFHHAAVSGIGMRHLCDMAVAYSYFNGKYDVNDYAGYLRECGLLDWTSLLNTVLVRYLGAPQKILPSSGIGQAVTDKDVERFIRLVMNDGNFGLEKKRRYSGFFDRARLLLKYAPGAYLARWFGLLKGRFNR